MTHPKIIRLQRLYSMAMLLVLCLTGPLWATVYGQDVQFRAAAPRELNVGQQFRVEYSVNAPGKDFQGPSFKGLSVLSGPSTSNSSSIRIINGQMTRSETYTFTYILRADQEGEFSIPAARISVDGQEYTSNSLSIKVNAAPAGNQQGNPQGSGRPRGNQAAPGSVGDNDVFLRAVVDKASPYLGEEVIITYQIFTRLQINLPGGAQQPSFPGFWTEDLLKDRKEYSQSRQTYNGQDYVVVEYKRLALFPQKAGEITIEPFELEVAARVQGRRSSGDPFFDNFFGGSFFNTVQTVPVKIRSNAVRLNVKPLPATGRPASFSGAVGEYSFSGETDRTKLKTNEALTLRYTLSGSGNIQLVEPPALTFPPDLEAYDPRTTDRVNATHSGVRGSRTFEYLAIPRAPGQHTIPGIDFSYFNPSSGKYETITVPPFTIEVERGEGDASTTSTGMISQEDVRFIGSDIRYIHTGDTDLKAAGRRLFLSTRYILTLLASVLFFIVLLVFWKRRISLRQDQRAFRSRKATRIARKHLRTARSMLRSGDHARYHESISQAVWGYLGDKLSIPKASLTLDHAEDYLRERGASEALILELRKVIETAEFARFAPPTGDAARQDLYDDALEVITRMENQLKK